MCLFSFPLIKNNNNKCNFCYCYMSKTRLFEEDDVVVAANADASRDCCCCRSSSSATAASAADKPSSLSSIRFSFSFQISSMFFSLRSASSRPSSPMRACNLVRRASTNKSSFKDDDDADFCFLFVARHHDDDELSPAVVASFTVPFSFSSSPPEDVAVVASESTPLTNSSVVIDRSRVLSSAFLASSSSTCSCNFWFSFIFRCNRCARI
mmetsp:Transcript_8161/g.17604  ORF Transcript_8161/g.17604 Transcript_8161/m.17604 type:complete len:210 (+) Transcript_8161:133-762(+)